MLPALHLSADEAAGEPVALASVYPGIDDPFGGNPSGAAQVGQENGRFLARKPALIGRTRFPVLNGKEIRIGFRRLQTRRSDGFSAAMLTGDPSRPLSLRAGNGSSCPFSTFRWL
jgi:hypothetical protein